MDLNIVTNLIRYDLARLKQSIVNFKNNPIEVLIIFLFACILSCIIFITFFYLTSPPKA